VATDVSELLRAVISGAGEKLAERTTVLFTDGLVDTFSALVVTSGRTDRQTRAIAEEIERQAQLVGWRPLREEGWTESTWIAFDYGDVIVHVFDDEHREYYDLEHLWAAAPRYDAPHPQSPAQ
jgi:ribosome-associated protein